MSRAIPSTGIVQRDPIVIARRPQRRALNRAKERYSDGGVRFVSAKESGRQGAGDVNAQWLAERSGLAWGLMSAWGGSCKGS